MRSDSLIYKLAVYLDLTGVPHLGHGPAVTDEAVHVLGEGAVLDTLPEHGDWQLDQRLRRQGPGGPVIVAVPHPVHEKFLWSGSGDIDKDPIYIPTPYLGPLLSR